MVIHAPACELCGGEMFSNNRLGICTRNEICRWENSRLHNRDQTERRAAAKKDSHNTTAGAFSAICKSCGRSIRHRKRHFEIGYGYCKASKCVTAKRGIRRQFGLGEHGKTQEQKLRNKKRLWAKVYGLSIEQVDELREDQGGRCMICRRDEKLVIDHCHRGRGVRGLLCATCNLGLGGFKDRPDWLINAATYLLASHQDPLDWLRVRQALCLQAILRPKASTHVELLLHSF